MTMFSTPISDCPGIAWPAVPPRPGAMRLGLLAQIEAAQWLPREAMLNRQMHQLSGLLRHVWKAVPYYRERLEEAGLVPDRPLRYGNWLNLRPLTRQDVQAAGDRLVSSSLPKEHGRVNTSFTSGSTGQPVKVLGTDVTALFWDVMTLREHLWQERDFSRKMAAIRRIPGGEAAYPQGPDPTGTVGSAGNGLCLRRTGPIHGCLGDRDQPGPARRSGCNVRRSGLSARLSHEPRRIPGPNYCIRPWRKAYKTSRQCISASVSCCVPHVRESCREIWGVGGRRYLQLPGSRLYVTAGAWTSSTSWSSPISFWWRCSIRAMAPLCKPGQVGRVVVTSLHNFAMPLLRYEIGDFAEVGGSLSDGASGSRS